MYKSIKENNEINNDAENEKVIIRLKRKIEETTVPSIYVKKSNKRVCNGIFYKHIDTIPPEEVESNKKNIDCINLFLKHEQLNCNIDLLFSEKKRKFNSLKSYEKDLKEAITSLKKYKIINQHVHYIDLDTEKKGKFKIIDIDLHTNANNNNESVENEKRKEGEHKNEQDYEYDLYILDNEKLQLENYMDYLYNIKNNNIDTSEVVVLEDVYGNNTSEYDAYSHSSSFNSNSIKEISDYPDESSSDGNNRSECSNYFDEDINSDDQDNVLYSDNHDNILYSDYHDNILYSDYHDNIINSDYHDNIINSDYHDNITNSDNFNENACSDDYYKSINTKKCDINIFDKSKKTDLSNVENCNHKNNSLECNSYKNNFKKKTENKLSIHNKKMNSLIIEEKIKDELQKRLKKKNEDLLNVTLSDKLKILEQMEDEYYNK